MSENIAFSSHLSILLSWLVKANLLKSYLNLLLLFFLQEPLTATPPRALTLQTPNSA